VETIRDDWKQHWQGKFKAAIEVTWLIPNCSMPLAKVNQFLQPVLAKKNNDYIVELALAAADSSSFKVIEGDLFQSRVRNLVELP